MVSRSLSKSYALAGLRFGFLIAQPQLIAEFSKMKDSYNCDALAIAGATAAIDDQQWLAENTAKVSPPATGSPPACGNSVLPRSIRKLTLSGIRIPACRSSRLRKLKQQRILVRYMDYSAWGDGLRISVGTDEQNDACLAALKSMM